MLAAAGAREVVGIDPAPAAIQAASEALPEAVHLHGGDLRRLEMDDNRFELVVCFGPVESADDPTALLDELVRVLVPGGLLVVSASSSADRADDDHPRSHGLTGDGLRRELSTRLSHVAVVTQSNCLLSAVGAPPAILREDGAIDGHREPPPDDAEDTRRASGALVLASDALLPKLSPRAAAADSGALGCWLATLRAQEAELADRDLQIAALEARLEERERLAELLVDAEQRLAAVPELSLSISQLEADLAAARNETEAARQEAQELDQMLMYGRRMLRYIRPLINPLRQARRRLRA
jgi:SAM-dependent methyltransferase